MKGRPLLEWLAFALVWGLMLAPLWRVTQAGGGRGAADAPEAADAGMRSAWVHVRFSETPQRFALRSGTLEIWAEEDVDPDMENLCDVLWSDLGPEIELEAAWSDAGRRAVEIGVAPVAGRRTRATVWTSEARARERLVFE